MTHSLNSYFDESELSGIVALMSPADRLAFVEFTKLYQPDGKRRRHLSGNTPTPRPTFTLRQYVVMGAVALMTLATAAYAGITTFMCVAGIGMIALIRKGVRTYRALRREAEWANAQLAQQYFVARLTELSVKESLLAREQELGIITEFEFMMDCYKQRYVDLRKGAPLQYVKAHDLRVATRYPETTQMFRTLARKRAVVSAVSMK